MPINRVAYVDQPLVLPRVTPDTSRLAGMYLAGGDNLAKIDLIRGQQASQMFDRLAGLYSGFNEVGRQQRAAATALAVRAKERADDQALTLQRDEAARDERMKEIEAQERIRKGEQDERSVADAIDKAPRGVVSKALFQAAQKFPNQAARFVTQDGMAVLPMTGGEKQAYDREKAAEVNMAKDNVRADEQLKIARGQLGIAQQKANAETSDKTTLTDKGVDIAALNYRKTGVMPPLGMGDKGTRQRIINRAAELKAPDIARIESIADIAGNKQDYAANTDSLKSLQKSRDAIGAFEQTAQKNIDVFLDVAGKVVDTGSPLANRLAREVSGTLLGSPDQAAYDAARQVATNEIAKITSNPTLAGQLSDSARHEVDAFNPRNATLAQTVRVMRLLKTEMTNRKDAMDAEISVVRQRGKAAPAPAPPAAGGVKVLSITPVGKP